MVRADLKSARSGLKPFHSGRESLPALPKRVEWLEFSLRYIPKGNAPWFFCSELALKRLELFPDALALKGERANESSLKALVPLRACV